MRPRNSLKRVLHLRELRVRHVSSYSGSSATSTTVRLNTLSPPANGEVFYSPLR